MSDYQPNHLIRQRRKKRSTSIIVILFTISLMVLLAVGYGFAEVKGLFRTNQTVIVDIPQGSSTAVVSTHLQKAGAISNPLLFRIYSRLAGADGSYQYGSFHINTGWSYTQIKETLQHSVEHQTTIRVTFPEGYNAYQYGDELQKVGLCTQKEFIEALNTHSFEFDFLKTISDNPLKMVHLEGFLFPDTYEFFKDENIDSIINRMLKNFQTKVLSNYEQMIATSGYSLEELIIFASIIQKESANVKEMYNVSSVFHNRLANDSIYPHLQSCTTNNYISDYIHPFYHGKNLDSVLAAYDTYNTPGFPVGAIANPGLDAIDAALHPEKNTLNGTYYFFVTDVEYTHYYGKTFNEHLANIEKAKKVNRTYGIEGLIS